jgi:hypothetical protein
VRAWYDAAAHPALTLGVVLGLEFAATAGLIWWAGWDKILHALSLSNTEWFGLCAAGQLIAYLGYGLALRATAGVDHEPARIKQGDRARPRLSGEQL